MWNRDYGLDINREDFANTSTLFSFQLEPEFPTNNTFLSLVKTGNIRLEVQFETALKSTTSCIVYSKSAGFFSN